MPASDVDQHDDDLAPARVGDGAVDEPAVADATGPRPAPRRPFDWKLWIACLPIAVGVLLVAWGVSVSITGDEATKLPEAIESIAPTPDAVQVLSQTNVVVDLDEGYEGRLTVDGVEYPTRRLEDFSNPNVEPGTQVDIPAGVLYEPGNDTLTFTPGPAIGIREFSQGIHTVRVVYWRTTVGETEARSYTWTFNVL